MLNSVRYTRLGITLILVHEVFVSCCVLGTAFDVATAMEKNVKELKKHGAPLLAQGMRLDAQVHDGRRWGVKLLG